MKGISTTVRSRGKRSFRGAAICWLLGGLGLAGAPPPRAVAATLLVGPYRALTTPSAAARIARDGDRVVIDGGTYRDCAIWRQSRLTIEARAGAEPVIEPPVCGDRGLFVFYGSQIVVRGLTFRGARDTAHNGAGILMEGDFLTIERGRFEDNENGVLAGGGPGSAVRVADSVFLRNGSCQGACAHGIYAGKAIAWLEVAGCTFTETHTGHHIKSKARVTVIRDSRIEDGPLGTASYLIDLPIGGAAAIFNNVLIKGPASDNRETAISIGEEDGHNPPGPLEISHNRFTNASPDPAAFVRNASPAPVHARRNVLMGRVIPLVGAGTAE